MKSIKLTLAALVAAFFLMPAAIHADDHQAGQKIGVDVGVEYNSTYYWRGMHFYGNDVGVFFPWVGTSIGDVYVMLSGEVGEGYLGGNADDEANDMEKDWLGLDLIATWSTTIVPDTLDLTLRGAYYFYPNSHNEDWGTENDVKNDFVDIGFSLTAVSLPLTPELSVTYSFYMDDDSIAGDNYQNVYVQLSAGHGFAITDAATLTLGGSIASFNYTSAGLEDDLQIVNDVQAFANLSVTSADGLTVYGQYSFGFTPVEEYYDDFGYGKYSHWATFGVSYSL